MPRSRDSTMTEISLRLSEDAVDRNGVARMGYLPSGPTNENSVIAPWIDVPVSTYGVWATANMVFLGYWY